MTKLGELSLSTSPEETITTIINDVVYSIRQLWNTLGFWTIDILSEDGTPFVTGIKLVSGSFILQQYTNIPFDIFIDSDIDPTRFNISDYILEIYFK